jgi:hypothetical protein
MPVVQKMHLRLKFFNTGRALVFKKPVFISRNILLFHIISVGQQNVYEEHFP